MSSLCCISVLKSIGELGALAPGKSVLYTFDDGNRGLELIALVKHLITHVLNDGFEFAVKVCIHTAAAVLKYKFINSVESCRDIL